MRQIIIETARDMGFTVDDSTEFIGPNSIFDSIDLVQFLLSLEEKTGISVTHDKVFSYKNSPFRTIATIEEFFRG